MKKVNPLHTAKATQQSDIPNKILKQNSNHFADYFYENINQCISKSIFPSDLKLVDVTPVYTKKSKNSKDNYRPVSILSNISKIYERCNYDQIQFFFDFFCSNINANFVEGYNVQHCLVSLIEKWKDFDYADDSTPYCAGISAEFVVNNLKQSPTILFEWLNNNYRKVRAIYYFQVILDLPLRLTIIILNRKMNKHY